SPMGVEKDNVTTFEVRVSINNPGGELKAEMTANAEIILEEHKNVLQIPEGAIIYDKDKKASVEVPDPHAKDGKRKLAVNIGISNGAKTEVLGGLKENDQVVLQWLNPFSLLSFRAARRRAHSLSACEESALRGFSRVTKGRAISKKTHRRCSCPNAAANWLP